jgi:hypothetical protein
VLSALQARALSHCCPLLTAAACASAVTPAARYEHGAYLRKHSVGHSLDIAASLLAEADKLMASKRVSGTTPGSWLVAGMHMKWG